MRNQKYERESEIIDTFIDIFNRKYRANIAIESHSDAPDFHCVDKQSGEKFDIEVSQFEDFPLDLASVTSQQIKRKTISPHTGDPLRRFEDDTILSLLYILEKKSKNHYGNNVALVLRHAFGYWDEVAYNFAKDQINEKLFFDLKNAYRFGVWLIGVAPNSTKIDSDIYKLV